MKIILRLALVAGLAGCAGRAPPPEPAIVYRDVPTAVAVGCVVDRPVAPDALRVRVPAAEWAQRAPGAKAQAVLAQAGRRMNHETAAAAATAGCADAKGDR